ncbi:hypothetical protein EJ08DRAFT_289313 [Tothia fuscella]|uniref:DUF7730 domain-containing protein n=1 Tax=Tothia fuscella TaxID=1048955 RepID=A0A9P4P077_9PEZI|nr:hypothetical protein EJ08DRAFT_289313 [Tothia fuscella]
MADKTSSTGLGLQSLPLELRLKIYRNLFIVGNVDFTRMHLVKGHFAKNDRLATESGETFMAVSATLQFLRVCKSVYAEGIPILYGENTYALTIHYAVRDIHLREAIGPGAMTTIKHLVVTGHHCMSMSAALGYQRLTGLQKLDIELGVNWFDPGKSSTWCRSSGVLRQADLHPSRGPKVGFLRAIFTLSQSISVRALARSRLLGQGFCDVSRYSNMRKGEFVSGLICIDFWHAINFSFSCEK